MKKLLTILLSFCFVLPAFASDVRLISNDAWMEHIASMQSLRQQILSIISKPGRTFEDNDKLAMLNQEFDERKIGWDAYLVDVAEQGAVEPQTIVVTATTGCEKIAACGDKMKACGHKMHGCRKGKDKAACCRQLTGKCCKENMTAQEKAACADKMKACGHKMHGCRKGKGKAACCRQLTGKCCKENMTAQEKAACADKMKACGHKMHGCRKAKMNCKKESNCKAAKSCRKSSRKAMDCKN